MAQFCLLHILATNVCVWLITVILEGSESFVHYSEDTEIFKIEMMKQAGGGMEGTGKDKGYKMAGTDTYSGKYIYNIILFSCLQYLLDSYYFNLLILNSRIYVWGLVVF